MKNYNIENINIDLKLKYKKIPTNIKEKLYFSFIQNPFVWETLNDIVFILSNGEEIVVPKGMEFDLASIPTILTGFIKEYNTCLPAYIFHDWCYIEDIVFNYDDGSPMNAFDNRLYIDSEMLRLATLYNPRQKNLHILKYRMVRLFGKSIYDRKKDTNGNI